MIELIKNNEDCQNWLAKHKGIETLNVVGSWADYEDYSHINKCKSLDELLDLYLFLVVLTGCDYVDDLYMEADYAREHYNDHELVELIDTFNKEMGREII